jgi:dTDP-glucose pyrophosphorylase
MSSLNVRIEQSVVSPDTPLNEALLQFERAKLGILLVCDADRNLLGVITDGDIRKAILDQVALHEPCHKISNTQPLTAPLGCTKTLALELMDKGRSIPLNQLPIVSASGKILDLMLRSDVAKKEVVPLSALVMAGGFGTRLYPLTQNTPKPMLPVGGFPVMERILQNLKESGIQHVYISTHFQAEKIRKYFGRGESLGLTLEYIHEEEPLGTAGCIGLLPESDDPLLVMNGDILTAIDFRALWEYHKKHQAVVTVAIRKYDVRVPYGVIECKTNTNLITHLAEKPVSSFFVNGGIYLLEKEAKLRIPKNHKINMTDLISDLLEEGRRLVAFPIIEYWIDIGKHDDYQKANDDFSLKEAVG